MCLRNLFFLLQHKFLLEIHFSREKKQEKKRKKHFFPLFSSHNFSLVHMLSICCQMCVMHWPFLHECVKYVFMCFNYKIQTKKFPKLHCYYGKFDEIIIILNIWLPSAHTMYLICFNVSYWIDSSIKANKLFESIDGGTVLLWKVKNSTSCFNFMGLLKIYN